MATTTDTTASSQQRPGRDYALVDCDIHPLIANFTDLREHMSTRSARRIFGETRMPSQRSTGSSRADGRVLRTAAVPAHL